MQKGIDTRHLLSIIQEIKKNIDIILKAEIIARTNEITASRLFMDHFLPELSSDTLLMDYDSFLQKNFENNKTSTQKGETILEAINVLFFH